MESGFVCLCDVGYLNVVMLVPRICCQLVLLVRFEGREEKTSASACRLMCVTRQSVLPEVSWQKQEAESSFEALASVFIRIHVLH